MFILNCDIDIDMIVPTFTVNLMNLVKVAIPILLVAYGMIDMAKAIMSNDEKQMKESQNKFIKRIIYAVVIFFVVAIVQLVFGMLAEASKSDDKKEGTIKKSQITSCISCFISNTSACKGQEADDE